MDLRNTDFCSIWIDHENPWPSAGVGGQDEGHTASETNWLDVN